MRWHEWSGPTECGARSTSLASDAESVTDAAGSQERGRRWWPVQNQLFLGLSIAEAKVFDSRQKRRKRLRLSKQE